MNDVSIQLLVSHSAAALESVHFYNAQSFLSSLTEGSLCWNISEETTPL